MAEEETHDATIHIDHTGSGVEVTVIAPDGIPNQAVHFARWLAVNLQELVNVAEEDWNRLQGIEPKPAEEEKLQLAGSTPRLIGPDGQLLN